jgi:hypothetical protein
MAMLVIRTQVYENYAAHTGFTGEFHWKAKGGSEYKILGVPLNADYDEIVAAAGVERDDDYFRENIIDWSIEGDDYLSWFEKSQLDYEGMIRHAEPSMDYAELVDRAAA